MSGRHFWFFTFLTLWVVGCGDNPLGPTTEKKLGARAYPPSVEPTTTPPLKPIVKPNAPRQTMPGIIGDLNNPVAQAFLREQAGKGFKFLQMTYSPFLGRKFIYQFSELSPESEPREVRFKYIDNYEPSPKNEEWSWGLWHELEQIGKEGWEFDAAVANPDHKSHNLFFSRVKGTSLAVTPVHFVYAPTAGELQKNLDYQAGLGMAPLFVQHDRYGFFAGVRQVGTQKDRYEVKVTTAEKSQIALAAEKMGNDGFKIIGFVNAADDEGSELTLVGFRRRGTQTTFNTTVVNIYEENRLVMRDLIRSGYQFRLLQGGYGNLAVREASRLRVD